MSKQRRVVDLATGAVVGLAMGAVVDLAWTSSVLIQDTAWSVGVSGHTCVLTAIFKQRGGQKMTRI